jgi:hypothetical protein
LGLGGARKLTLDCGLRYDWQPAPGHGVPGECQPAAAHRQLEYRFAAGFKAPYATFPMSSTLAQALRPYPQFGGLGTRWAPLGNDSSLDQAHILVAGFNYELPKMGANSWVHRMVHGVPGQPLFLKDLNSHSVDPNKEFVLSPKAWSGPAPGEWGYSAVY